MTDPAPTESTSELPAAAPNRRRPVLLGSGIAGAAILVGAGAFAFTQLSGGGPQPHDVLPDSVIAYARIDLDPSADQKIAALRLLRKFPTLADEIGIQSAQQDVRRLIVNEATKDCDIDFEKDVEPWLGSRVGVGMLNAKEIPDAVFALQVDDEKAARAGLRALEKCGDESNSGIAFLDGYAIVAETQALADQAKKNAVTSPLADDEDFTEAMSDVGDPGLASAWMDMKALFEIPEIKREMPADVLAQIGQSSSLAFTLRAESDSLELATASRGLPTNAATDPIDIGSLPAGTAAAIGIRMPAEAVRDQWSAMVEGMEAAGEKPAREFEAFESGSGLRLPEDLETLFSGGLTLAVGGRNLETLPALQGPPNPADFDLGLRIGGTEGKDLAERLVTLVRDTVGLELSTTQTKSGTVIATNSKAFSTKGESLQDSGTFEDVIGGDAQQAIYLNVATIVEALASSNPPPEVADVLDELKPLQAAGLDFAQDGDLGHGSLTLTFK